jgi:hypothetical protein
MVARRRIRVQLPRASAHESPDPSGRRCELIPPCWRSIAQALVFRVAGHHLDERTDRLTAVVASGRQQTPPGWAAVAFHARAEGRPDREQVATVTAMRGAPYVVPRRDDADFTAALVPAEEGLRALVGPGRAKECEVVAGLRGCSAVVLA